MEAIVYWASILSTGALLSFITLRNKIQDFSGSLKNNKSFQIRNNKDKVVSKYNEYAITVNAECFRMKTAAPIDHVKRFHKRNLSASPTAVKFIITGQF